MNNPCAAVFEKLKKAVQDYFNEGGQCPKKIRLTFTGAFRKILRERLTTEELEHVELESQADDDVAQAVEDVKTLTSARCVLCLISICLNNIILPY